MCRANRLASRHSDNVNPILFATQLVALVGAGAFAVKGLRSIGAHWESNRVLRGMPRPVRRRVARWVRRGELPPPGDPDRELVIIHARSQAPTSRWISGMLSSLGASQAIALAAVDESQVLPTVLIIAGTIVFLGLGAMGQCSKPAPSASLTDADTT